MLEEETGEHVIILDKTGEVWRKIKNVFTLYNQKLLSQDNQLENKGIEFLFTFFSFRKILYNKRNIIRNVLKFSNKNRNVEKGNGIKKNRKGSFN